ncbi:MAG TPA: VTT domain-containing protein, partial [Anaerolineales bacterium]|nr:VTT domain-containing protein [Anaerolineales bacterium]
MVAISVYIFTIRDQVETLTRFGYPGVFLFTLVTSATIILPAPSLVVVFTLGGVLNPLWVGAAAGVGATLGELSGYLAGFSGRVVVENTRNYDRMRGWMEAHTALSGWLIMLLAFIPLPIIDLAGMAAGALRMPVWQFQLWCLAGKLPKMVLVAWLGTLSVEWIERL